MKSLRRMLYSILFIVSAAWLFLALFLYFFQTRMIYFPEKTLEFTPAVLSLPYEDVYLTTSDGISIHGWFMEKENALSTVLVLHGNAGNISHRLETLQIFYELGMAVFIIDYRGYGRSEGSPSEAGTYLDAKAAWFYLTEGRKLDAKDIIVFGRSLGGAVAVWLAERHEPAALVIESTFTSIPEMGKRYYPYLPVGLLTRIRYPTIERIGRINRPVLVIHSRDDEIIPFEFGQSLYSAAPDPKVFLEISGGHNDGFLIEGKRYREGLLMFIQNYAKG